MIIREVKEVFLRKSSFTLSADTNAYTPDGMNLRSLSHNRIVGVLVAEQYEDKSPNKVVIRTCFFRILCIIKAIEAVGNPDTAKVLFEIEAEYDVGFDADSELEVEELEAFSSDDVISNAAWPYWKEHVSSLCSKAGLILPQIPAAQKNAILKITSKQLL
ncbi:hypothetical protein [Klebsiella variicola]|uniref:hypothetical protein n=1 Tax=Klebsiella variicola TaxID=244366 RepID=UPI000FCB0168|nr:hypothetical protein [Klebsiella variicola]